MKQKCSAMVTTAAEHFCFVYPDAGFEHTPPKAKEAGCHLLLLPVDAVLPFVGQVGYKPTERGKVKKCVEIGIGKLEFIQSMLRGCGFGFAAEPAEVQIIQMNFSILAVEGEQESRRHLVDEFGGGEGASGNDFSLIV